MIEHAEVMYSFVCPVQNQAEGLEAFYGRLKTAAESLRDPYEMLFINDGSSDESLEIIRGLAKRDGSVKYLDFSRSFGLPAALTAGLDHANGRAVICLEVDGRHPPEAISLMVEKWQAGAEIVHGVCVEDKSIGLVKRLIARMFNRLMYRPGGLELADMGDFRLLDRKVVLALRGMREQARLMRPLLRWAGFRQASQPYKPEKRYAGLSRPSLRQLVSNGLAGLLNYSMLPIRTIGVLGLLLLLAGVLYLAVGGTLALLGKAGFALWAVMLLSVSGLNLLCLAAVGEYVGQAFQETKGRPLYVVRYSHGFEEDEIDAPEAPRRELGQSQRFSVMT